MMRPGQMAGPGPTQGPGHPHPQQSPPPPMQAPPMHSPLPPPPNVQYFFPAPTTPAPTFDADALQRQIHALQQQMDRMQAQLQQLLLNGAVTAASAPSAPSVLPPPSSPSSPSFVPSWVWQVVIACAVVLLFVLVVYMAVMATRTQHVLKKVKDTLKYGGGGVGGWAARQHSVQHSAQHPMLAPAVSAYYPPPAHWPGQAAQM